MLFGAEVRWRGCLRGADVEATLGAVIAGADLGGLTSGVAPTSRMCMHALASLLASFSTHERTCT